MSTAAGKKFKSHGHWKWHRCLQSQCLGNGSKRIKVSLYHTLGSKSAWTTQDCPLQCSPQKLPGSINTAQVRAQGWNLLQVSHNPKLLRSKEPPATQVHSSVSGSKNITGQMKPQQAPLQTHGASIFLVLFFWDRVSQSSPVLKLTM